MVFPSNVSFGLLHSVCVSLILIAPSISIAETVEVSIPATTSFTAVGVRLTKNEKATILADGIISYGSRGPESCQGFSVGPRGCAEEAICPGPGGCGSLLGRVNGGAPFLVGDSATATGPGVLELGINDIENAFGDNAGEYSVRIIVTRGGSVAGTVTGVTCKNEVPPLLGSEACSEGPASNVRVVGDFQEQTRNVRTGADGTYLLAFKKKGTYRISPSLAKAGFEPKSYRVPITNVDVTGKDFVIQPAKVVTLTIRKRKFSLNSNYVQNGGKLKICNMDPFPHNPFSNSVGNEFSLFGTKKVPIGGCRAVFLTNNTNGGIDLVQVFDQNSPNATIGVYVAP